MHYTTEQYIAKVFFWSYIRTLFISSKTKNIIGNVLTVQFQAYALSSIQEKRKVMVKHHTSYSIQCVLGSTWKSSERKQDLTEIAASVWLEKSYTLTHTLDFNLTLISSLFSQDLDRLIYGTPSITKGSSNFFRKLQNNGKYNVFNSSCFFLFFSPLYPNSWANIKFNKNCGSHYGGKLELQCTTATFHCIYTFNLLQGLYNYTHEVCASSGVNNCNTRLQKYE